MKIFTQPNQATLELLPSEGFYLKPSLLQGFPYYDWTLPPPFPWGSPFIRLYHSCWIMKYVEADKPTKVPVYGTHARGNFTILELAEGETYSVAIRCLAGFSSRIRSIHTRIKISPRYWLLHEHFFSIFQGPGVVLLYSESPMEISRQTEFMPSRLVSFKSNKVFRPIAPKPKQRKSQLINLLFSHEVIWQFAEPDLVIVETHHETGVHESQNPLWRWFKHLLSFFKI